jgi:hypothetical protein
MRRDLACAVVIAALIGLAAFHCAAGGVHEDHKHEHHGSEYTTTTHDIGFEECLAVISDTANKVGSAPINLIETATTRMVQFSVADGVVIVTCTREDGKMRFTEPKK